jgi:leucine-zipper of insertion element IS481
MSLRGIVWLFNDYTNPQEALVAGNAPMTPRGRMIMIERIAAGRPIAHVAAEMGVARKTADKWWRRWLVVLSRISASASAVVTHTPLPVGPSLGSRRSRRNRVARRW